MPSKAIVSSGNLLHALQKCLIVEFVAFQVMDLQPGISVGGIPVGGVCTGFEDFYLPAKKARKLIDVLRVLTDQPIAISYDGNWLTIHEVIL